jgi:hypothetical protein
LSSRLNREASCRSSPIFDNNSKTLSHIEKTLGDIKEYPYKKAAAMASAKYDAVKDTAAVKSSEQVYKVVRTAQQALPHVTAYVEKNAVFYVEYGLANASTLAGQAVDIVANGGSPDAARLAGQYALDLANALGNFVAGVSQGVHNSLISTTEVLSAVAHDPTLVTNLSNNVMRLLTSSPDQIVNAAKTALTTVGTSILDYGNTMKYGTPAEK